MSKKIIFATIFSFMMPLLAFAQEIHAEHSKEDITTYVADHWHDIPVIILLVLAAIFAFRVAFLYGGIIGKALNLMSAGVLVLAISNVVGNFLLHLIDAEESYLHYGVDFMQIIGAGLIAFAFLRLHAETKQQFAVNSKK